MLTALALLARCSLSIDSLQIWILLIWQRHGRCILHLLLILLHSRLIDLDFRWSKSWRSHEFERLIADELSREPQERLLEVVVRLGGDVVVLEILLAVEGDGLSLDFSLLHIDLVACEHDWDVFAHADQISVPVGDVLVGDARGDVEHDDAALPVDIVAVTQSSELLLSCCVPYIELDWSEVLLHVSFHTGQSLR